MKELSFEKMEDFHGGKIGLPEAAGLVCAAALSGAIFGGFGLFITGAIYGPSCAGLILAAALE